MFWDSSALIPCIISEDLSAELSGRLADDKATVLWWATPVECVSALERRRREAGLADDAAEEARRRLFEIVDQSHVVQAHASVRDRALRLLAVHALRAADALQLAAALVACDDAPQGEGFVCLDGRLRAAARKEGLSILPERV